MKTTPHDGDVERRKLLINLATAKIAKLEDALERNWIAHLILAGIGFSLVYGIADLPKLFSAYFVKGDYDEKGVAAIVLALLLYYFMKLGHLLSSYADASDLQSALIGDFNELETLPLRKSTSFLVEAFSDESYRNKTFWPYLFVTTAVVSLAQSSALFLLGKAYRIPSWLTISFLLFGAFVIGVFTLWTGARGCSLTIPLALVCGGAILTAIFASRSGNGWPLTSQVCAETIVLTLYLLFWGSQKHRRQSALVVLSSLSLACGWVALFAFTLR